MCNPSDARSPQHPKLTYVTPEDPFWRRSFINCIEAVTGQKKLNSLYHKYRLVDETTGNIWADAISHLHLHIKGLTETESSIPANGPLVIVSNHPYGVLDGLSLCYAVSLIRQEGKRVATHLAMLVVTLSHWWSLCQADHTTSWWEEFEKLTPTADLRQGGLFPDFNLGLASDGC